MLEKLPDALGHALSDVRAGLDKTVFHSTGLRQGMAAITVASLAFADHARIPARYTADGEGLSPPLHWSGVPPHADSVVLIVEDADSPTPQPLVHAIALGLPADADGALAEGALGRHEADDAEHGAAAADLVLGRNSYLRIGWLPPDPPPGHGAHRYVFQVYALGAAGADDAPLPEHPGRDALRQALQQRALASGCCIGTYARDGSVTERREATARDETAAALAPLSPFPPAA